MLYLLFVIGDGIMDMMLKPALQTYESKDAPKDVEEGDDDDWIQKIIPRTASPASLIGRG